MSGTPPLAALQGAWAGRDDCTVLDTGFGGGDRFAAIRRAWLADPARAGRLHYIGLAPAPPPAPAGDAALAALWPPPLAGWHALDLGPQAPRLTLVVGPLRHTLRALDCRADAIDLTGTLGDEGGGDDDGAALITALARLAVPGALVYGAAADQAAALRRAGFEAATAGPAAVWRFAPRPTVRRPPARGSPPGHALVIGAGLAGAWAAHALQAQGWTVTVFDRHAAPAQEASGNPAGLFHGTVLADDGPHARFHRAAALHAARAMRPWISGGQVPGAVDGLLRLAAPGESPADLQRLADRHALPAAYVQVLDAAAASGIAGFPIDRPAWMYPGGGWVDPGALVRRLLADVDLRCGVEVATLRRHGQQWQLLAAGGDVIASAGTVVLANAADAARLWPAAAWPLGRSRGQISVWPAVPPGTPTPRLPVTGGGYVVALPDGRLLAGATAAPGDEDAELRDADHHFNAVRLQQITGFGAPLPTAGRVGWRTMTPDRLPLIGPVPLSGAGTTHRLDRVPRAEGLHIFSGLGSRGLTWAPLGSQMLAAWISGAPMPVEAALRDAVDPARWRVRAARRERQD